MCFSVLDAEDTHTPAFAPGHHENPWIDTAPMLQLNSDLPGTAGGCGFTGGGRGLTGEADKQSSGGKEQQKSLTSNNEKQSNDITSLSTSIINPLDFLKSQEVGGALGVASQQLLHVHEAFAGDDVVNEFQDEKKEAERKRETDIQTTPHLPGMCLVVSLTVCVSV